MVKPSSKAKTARKIAPKAEAEDRPIALTLKIDGAMYLRLATLRATQRRSHQDILRAALEEYLKKSGV